MSEKITNKFEQRITKQRNRKREKMANKEEQKKRKVNVYEQKIQNFM